MTSITPAFSPGEVVSHIADETARGVITAFMVRGRNHSYDVQWGIDKSTWHLDFELRKAPDPPKQIGIWSQDGR